MKTAIQIIQELGFTVKDFTGTQVDFDGVDCIVSDGTRNKHVDYKADTTLETIFYPDVGYTGLISLLHVNSDGTYHLPKYLERTDVYVWLIDVASDKNLVFEISPSMLQNLDKYIIDYKWKGGNHDYLGKKHLLGVIPLSQCRMVDNNNKLYIFSE